MTKSLLRGLSAGLALAMSAAFGQAPDPNAAPKPAGLTFEVATIKPAEPLTPQLVASGKLHAGMSVDGARVDIGFFSLSDMIRAAYKLKSYQLSGPDWLSVQRFDILAKMPEGATKEQVPEMLQALLADRFKLAIQSCQLPFLFHLSFRIAVSPAHGRLSGLATHAAARSDETHRPRRLGQAG
jgi:hypothetical protein